VRTLNLLVIHCGDIERARAFFECFGMTFKKHAHGSGPEHYACEEDAGVFELYPRATDGPADQTGLGFDSHDLGATADLLRSSGFAPGAVAENPWGRTFVVRDPDNRRVEVKHVER